MTETQKLLFSALEEKRPLVLVLGQDAWRENGQEDPVLANALAHLGREGNEQRGWNQLLQTNPAPSTFYEWLTERFEHRVPPSWLSALGEIPWSAVFTSSLDPTLKELFSKRQRPELVLTSAEMPPAIRSRIRPPIYHLFGHAGSLDPRARPPLERRELNIRRVNDAQPLVRRILDTATRLGLVLVEGVVAERDWLRIDDFFGAMGNAGYHQIIWFKGRTTQVPDDEGFSAAVDASNMVVVEERLSTVLTELRSVNRLADLLVPESEEVGKVTFKEGHLDTSPADRLHVEAVASIVDDAWMAPLAALGQDREYAAFRQFHGEPGNVRSLVEGIRRDFAIKRDYEDDLATLVFEAINDHARFNTPIILHGQSATGKSIAFARIVARVRKAKDAAVLYSNNRVPQSSEIAEFCHQAEESGAKVTLIVCDTNQDVRPYVDLLSGLRSRGHRVVVLGSRYRFIDDEGSHLETTIEAPADLAERERCDLSTLLKRFTNEKVEPQYLKDHHILSFLYRALPLTRYRIGFGLGAEASRTERMVREKRADYLVSHPPNTLIAQRLIDAGVRDTFVGLFNDRQRQAIESEDTAGQTIDLVMAAGSLSCPVPFNLLLRLTTDRQSLSSPTHIAQIFGGLDLFRWQWADDEHNELLVAPRLTLEAELICRRRLGSAHKEAECVINLIGAIRSIGVDRDHETRFLFNVLRQIGPHGPRGNRYRSSYVTIANTLTKLRTQLGIVHPSIILQESAFRRHAVREKMAESDSSITLLNEARDAVQQAINDIAIGSLSASRRTKRSLLVELATIYGFIAHRQAEEGNLTGEIWSTYLAAKSSVRQAASATDNYFPMDIGLWTPSDILKKCEMEDWQRAELQADIYDILDQINADALGPDQRERFDVRRMKTGDVLGNKKLADTAFENLIDQGSAAGCYLRARDLAPEWNDHRDEFSDEEREQARQAAEFLDEHTDLVTQDERCLSLLLECKWIFEVGRRPFVGQRQPLPAKTHAIQRLLDIVTKLNEACGDNPRNATRYLAATLTWVSGGERAATEMFRRLDRDTEYEDPSRVVRRHLIADHDGRPKRFDGRIERELSGSCKVRLDDTRQVVRMLSKDFPTYDIAYGRQVREFGVAFNFIGPIATPIIGR